MKKLFRFLVVSLLLAAGLSAISCSDDNNDTYNDSIVGTWEQVNDYGTVITVRFNANKSGSVHFVYPNNIGDKTENLEYDYMHEDRFLKIIGSSLKGEYEVTLTATKLQLHPYYENTYIEFTRK